MKGAADETHDRRCWEDKQRRFRPSRADGKPRRSRERVERFIVSAQQLLLWFPTAYTHFTRLLSASLTLPITCVEKKVPNFSRTVNL